ncbi:Polymerase/histidinol phosphatase-like protein, partial [Dimargaris cristalligena]
ILVLLTLVGLISTLLTNAYRPSKYRLDRLAFPWVNRPQNYLRPFDPNFPTDYNVLLEGHSHTTLSDGDMTPQQLVEFYRASGFNALIVSDHNTVAGGLAAEKYAQEHYPDSFLVIPAQEYSCCRIHMNLINIRETIPVTSAFPSNTELKRVIEQTHALGGLVVVNHIPWSNKTETDYNPFHESVTGNYATLPGHPTRSELLELGIDGIEIMNGPVFDTISYQRAVSSSSAALFAITGNDIHHPGPVYSWTVLKSANFSTAAILDELRHRRTSFLVEPSGTRQTAALTYNPAYLWLAPLVAIADYFTAFYDRQRGMYSFTGAFCQPERVSFHLAALVGLVFYIFITVAAVRLGRSYCQRHSLSNWREWLRRGRH